MAVLAVLIFHIWPSVLPGGFLGVSVFFTLSGYLITGLLLAEHRAHGRIDLRVFWARRFRRLLPAALITLAVVAVLAQWLPSPADMTEQVLAALAYIYNWFLMASGGDYGSLFAQPSPIEHFWSLAIEEQFYVVFPLLAACALRVGRTRGLVAMILVLLGSSLTLTLSGFLEPAASYLSTFTRAAEILVGALLAVVLPLPRLARTLRTAWRRLISVVGVVALAGLVVATRVADYETVVANRWFLPVTAVVSAAGLVFAATPSADRTLGSVVPAWLGRRSYGLYLVHWPIVVWLDAPGVVQFGLALVLAEASYRVVEAPIRFRRLLPTDGRAGLAGLAAVIVVGVVAVAPGTIIGGDGAVASAAPGSVATVPPLAAVGTTPTTAPEVSASGSPASASASPVPVTRAPRDPGRPLTVWMIGDSALDGILDWLTGRRNPSRDFYEADSDQNAAYPFGAGDRQYQLVDLAIPACEGSEDAVKIRLGDQVVDESEPCRGWRERWASALQDWGPPDVVLWQLGGATTWVARSWVDDPSVLTVPADLAWERAWRRSVRERLGWLFDRLPTGTPVLWSTPALPNRDEYKRAATPDDVEWQRITTGTELTAARQREIAAAVPGLTLLDFNAWVATSGPDGGPLPGTIDGVHWDRNTTEDQVWPWLSAKVDEAAG